MKLTDTEISLRCVDEDVIGACGYPLIIPFNSGHLTPNGYDLSVDEIELDGKVVKLEEIKEFVRIPPKTFFKVMTLETVNLPKDLVAQLWLRSSYARKGVIGSFGFIDSGFCGKLALSLYNASDELLILSASKKAICQIVFEHFSEPEKGYEERSGNYQNQESLKDV